MVSLLAIFEAPLATIVDFLYDSAESIGLEMVQPLPPIGHSWHSFMLDGVPVFVSIRKPYNLPSCENSVWLELYDSGMRTGAFTNLFYRLLTSPSGSSEVVLTDDSGDCTWPLVTHSSVDANAISVLDSLEASNSSLGVCSLRALHETTLGRFPNWSAEVRARGLAWNRVSSYFVLDLQWAIECRRLQIDPEC